MSTTVSATTFAISNRRFATSNGGIFAFFFSSRRRHTRWTDDWSSDVCSSDLGRDQLLDPHDGDEDLREGQAHPAVPLRLDDADGPRLGHGEVGAADGDRDVQELAAEVGAGDAGQRSEERRVGKECRCGWWRDD